MNEYIVDYKALAEANKAFRKRKKSVLYFILEGLGLIRLLKKKK